MSGLSAIAALKYELTADPLARGYSGMTDAAAATSLDAVNITQTSSIPIANVEGYLLLDGTLIRMEDYLAANTSPSALRTAVAALLRVISSTRLEMFQITSLSEYENLQGLIQVMVSGDMLSSQQATDLLNMAVTMVSRAQDRLATGHFSGRCQSCEGAAMRHTVLPLPPNPDDYAYKSNPLAFNRAQYEWMTKVKGLLEDTSKINDRPMAQQFAVGSFTTNTTISGTSTGTDVANFISSLVTAMTAKGFNSHTVSRSGG